MPPAREKGVTVLALKSMAYTPWPEDAEKTCEKCWYKPVGDPEQAETALRFALSQDITAAIPPGDENLYHMALQIAKRFKPMNQTEQNTLLEKTKGVKPLFPL